MDEVPTQNGTTNGAGKVTVTVAPASSLLAVEAVQSPPPPPPKQDPGKPWCPVLPDHPVLTDSPLLGLFLNRSQIADKSATTLSHSNGTLPHSSRIVCKNQVSRQV
ncbi:hypothetical protein FQR65_LT10583 [Abscondita terminalis]|nr:hypothetical protein FQR65_LT10583 [Abscondita terminalis]